jgi:hypothetical protein
MVNQISTIHHPQSTILHSTIIRPCLPVAVHVTVVEAAVAINPPEVHVCEQKNHDTEKKHTYIHVQMSHTLAQSMYRFHKQVIIHVHPHSARTMA